MQKLNKLRLVPLTLLLLLLLLLSLLIFPVYILVGVSHIQKTVLVMMFMIQQAYGGRCWWYTIIHKKKESVIRSKMYTFAYKKIELAHSQVIGDQKFLLVQRWVTGIGCLFNNNRYAIWIFSAYFISLRASLLEYMVFFKLKIHIHFGAVFCLYSSYLNKKVSIYISFKIIFWLWSFVQNL